MAKDALDSYHDLLKQKMHKHYGKAKSLTNCDVSP